MAVMIKQQRILLLKRLDKLSADLTQAKDTEEAERVLEEMKNIGIQLESLVRNHVPDHQYTGHEQFKVLGAKGGNLNAKNNASAM